MVVDCIIIISNDPFPHLELRLGLERLERGAHVKGMKRHDILRRKRARGTPDLAGINFDSDGLCASHLRPWMQSEYGDWDVEVDDEYGYPFNVFMFY
uniref:Uncharacterized protein n=1 Tax=Kalanchoe fedtschenkoi TaxID=63787 RepID=A0A7N0TM97_KALFE